ncbi:CXXC-type zinc finger protein 1 [Aphelenchoides bicaudatus]|nr:CXXC-type zinc finger protein 1 [Aphelenchoides bicaudatus]
MIKGDNREEEGGQPSTADSASNSSYKCGSCIACFRENDCNKCANCLEKTGSCLRRVCVNPGLEPNNSQQSNDASAKSNGKKDESKKKYKLKETKNNSVKKNKLAAAKLQASTQSPVKEQNSFIAPDIVVSKRKPHKPHKPHVWRPKELRGFKKGDEVSQQCYGPNCAKASRPHSKYCSDDCGLLLADHRLKYILKDRVTDFYKIQPFAEKLDDKKIRDLTVKKAETESDLELASKYADLLDVYITSLCKTEPQPEAQPQASSSQTQEYLICCPVCAQDFSANQFLSHVDSCSTEQERKFVYGSRYSLAENPSDIICDYYNPSLQTYCRRLRYACAEHYNDSLGNRMTTCGYPLNWSSSQSMRLQEMFTNFEDTVSGWNLYAFTQSMSRALEVGTKLATEYFHIFEAYRTRGDALTLLSNSRLPSNEQNFKEDVDYHGEQLSSTDVLNQKQEELSVENLYHTIKATRSAKSASNASSQTLTASGGLLDSSSILNGV